MRGVYASVSVSVSERRRTAAPGVNVKVTEFFSGPTRSIGARPAATSPSAPAAASTTAEDRNAASRQHAGPGMGARQPLFDHDDITVIEPKTGADRFWPRQVAQAETDAEEVRLAAHHVDGVAI